MAHSNLRTLCRFWIRYFSPALIVFSLGACVTRPDAHDTDDDLDKWYVHCRLHDQPWCLGPFRRERDANKAGWEHEFWLHMSQNTARTDHEPCQSN